MTRKKKKFFYQPKIKVDPEVEFTYQNYAELRRFVNSQGSIYSREVTGLSLKKQKSLAKAVKRARHLALLPFTQTF